MSCLSEALAWVRLLLESICLSICSFIGLKVSFTFWSPQSWLNTKMIIYNARSESDYWKSEGQCGKTVPVQDKGSKILCVKLGAKKVTPSANRCSRSIMYLPVAPSVGLVWFKLGRSPQNRILRFSPCWIGSSCLNSSPVSGPRR